jgi:hypothetical protein
VLATTANQAPAWQPQSAIAIGPVIATGSSEPRFVSDRFGDVINVKDFGAVGDGIANDAAAIQAAIDVGGMIYFPQGTYKCNSGLTVDPTKVALQGNGSTLNFSAMTSGTAIAFGATGSSEMFDHTRWSVSGLRLIGPSSSSTVDGVKLESVADKSTRVAFYNVEIKDFRTGIYALNRSYLCQFYSCKISFCDTGFWMPAALNDAGENISFYGCTFANGDMLCVKMENGAGDLRFVGCSFDYTGDGLFLVNNGRVWCHSCHFEFLTTQMDVIPLRVAQNSSDQGILCIDGATFIVQRTEANCTIAASTNEVSVNGGQPFANGDQVTFSGLTGGGGGLSNGTVYFVINAQTNIFQLSLSSGGSAIDITSDTSGVVTHYPDSTFSFVDVENDGHVVIENLFTSGTNLPAQVFKTGAGKIEMRGTKTFTNSFGPNRLSGEATENMLVDGGFEETSIKDLAWITEDTGTVSNRHIGKNIVLQTSTAESRSGSRSLEMEKTSFGSGADASFIIAAPVPAGASWCGRLFYKKAGAQTGNVFLSSVFLKIAGFNGPANIAGSATYDPPNLIDGAGNTTTVTVNGAALGDYAEASFSLDLQGITTTAWVSAADTVSVRFQNETGGTIDLGSGTLRARVTRASNQDGLPVVSKLQIIGTATLAFTSSPVDWTEFVVQQRNQTIAPPWATHVGFLIAANNMGVGKLFFDDVTINAM